MITFIKSIPKWLWFVLLCIVILRIPTLFDPYAYGDEMIYLSLGHAARKGMVLYRDIHDNKPPMLYWTAAIAGNLFWFRVILGAWMLLVTVLFWRLTHSLFRKNEPLVIVSTLIFAIFTTIPLFEGQVANSELFMIGFSIAAFLIAIARKLTWRNLLLIGMLFSLAALFKIPAAFDVPALFLYWVITSRNRQELVKAIRNSLIVSLGFAIPILLSFGWYAARGAFWEYLIAGFAQNVGYLSSFRPDDVTEPFLIRNGPLLIRGALVAAGVAILFLLRKKMSKQFLLMTLWLLFALFAAALSERPYPHYLVQALPAVSIFLGMIFTNRKREHLMAIIPLTLFAIVPVYYQYWFYQSASYYKNFISYATGNITKKEFFTRFDGSLPAKYEISEHIKNNADANDKIFVWGNTATIYALTGNLPPIRFVADYHVFDFYSKKETVTVLAEKPPLFVVILKGSIKFDELDQFVQKDYQLDKIVDGSEVWRRK